jgi:regulatory protein
MTETDTTFITDKSKLWAKRSAVHYLGTYASSIENLRQTMVKRALRKHEGIPNEEAKILANHAIEFCIANKFISDESYAGTKAAAGVRKGHSRNRILKTLEQKGVERETASEALRDVDDLYNATVFAKRKRVGPWRSKELDNKQKQREFGSFARNMFSNSIASRVINMTIEDAEEILIGSSPQL